MHQLPSDTEDTSEDYGFLHLDFQIPQPCSSGPRSTVQCSPSEGSVLELNDTVNMLWTNAVAPSTRCTYQTAFHVYVKFLLLSNIITTVCISEVHVTEDYLISFVAYCVSKLQISYSTIKLYLCGVKFMCLQNNINYPDNSQLCRLKAIMNGVKRVQLPSRSLRYPVTFDILLRTCFYLRKVDNFYNLMLETVCTVAFFGFLRCGEFTCKEAFDPSIHLCMSDLSIFEDYVHLQLKISKTDPFRKGVIIKLFSTDNVICPFTICCKYLKASRTKSPKRRKGGHHRRNPSELSNIKA
ncbi:uncharacterized protein LOC128191319 [Crassostrea angulata]|uniref:uncharacterized protein LOC128191319 n=1 Tax=Magallana angulata TaxID=2784310 RepID=UPI0022B1B877|nr:uncharacterized protein LOC128191319 [Crassostrea angulata]